MRSGPAERRDVGAIRPGLSRLFLGRTRRLYVQFLRYLVVGLVATSADFSLYILLVKAFAVHYLLGNAAGFSAGLVVHYVISVCWVFASRQFHSRTAEFAVFAVVGLAGLGLSESCMYVGVHVIGLYDVTVKAMATCCTLVWNFSMRKWLLFRDERQGEPPADGTAT